MARSLPDAIADAETAEQNREQVARTAAAPLFVTDLEADRHWHGQLLHRSLSNGDGQSDPINGQSGEWRFSGSPRDRWRSRMRLPLVTQDQGCCPIRSNYEGIVGQPWCSAG